MEVAITKKTVKKVKEKSKTLLLPFLMFFAVLFGITIVPNFLNNHRQYIFQPMINSHEGININYFPLVNNQEIKNEKIEKNEDEEVVIDKNKNKESEKLFDDNKNENKNENDKDNDNDLNDNSIVENKNDNVNKNKHNQRVNLRTFLFLIFVIIVSLMFILIIEKNNSRSFMRKHGGNDNNNIFNEDGYHNI
jgi:hypothetical protein